MNQIPTRLNGSSLDFVLERSFQECFCLLESFLELELSVVKLNKDGVEQRLDEDKDLVSFSPFIGNTLFRAISATMNDTKISWSMGANQHYEGIIAAIMHMTPAEQKNYLSGALLELSAPDTHSYIAPRPDPVTKKVMNNALSVRHTAAAFPKLPIVTPVPWPLFMCDRIFPTGIELKLSFALNSPEMCLIAPIPKEGEDPVPNYSIRIDVARLYIQKYRLSPVAQARQEKILASPDGARFPMICPNTTSFNLMPGATEVTRPLVYSGRKPSTVYLFMVDRGAANGSIHKDPFNFQPFKLKEAYLEMDGAKLPDGLGYRPVFGKGRFKREWMLSRKQQNFLPRELCFDWSDMDSGGYCILPFSISPDKTWGCGTMSGEEGVATLSLHLAFHDALADAITVFTLLEYPRILSLDAQRRPSWTND